MESAKRASMREGPLAALFRKTDEVQEAQRDREVAAEPTPTPAPPTPAERLRSAFSSELTETPPAPRHPAPVITDPFARSESNFGQARVAGSPVIRVVGVGGAGVNAVNRMVEAQVHGIEFIAINT